MAASYGPKPTLVLTEPAEKRGSEVANSSVMTSAEEGNDLDEETARNRTSAALSGYKEATMGKRGEKRERRSAILESEPVDPRL